MSAAAFSTSPRPDFGNPQADERARAAVVRVAGPPSAVPLAQTLARVVGSAFAPLMVAGDGALHGHEGGQPVLVTRPAVLDLLRRHGLAAQLGVPVSDGDVDEALRLAAGHARVEQERRVVAEQHLADRRRTDLVEDAGRAERRAELLRELAELGDVPQSVPADDPPGRSRWRRG